MFLTIIIYLLVDDLNNIDIILEVELFIRFFSNLEIILEIKLKNFIISFFDISFTHTHTHTYIYIYIYIYLYKIKVKNGVRIGPINEKFLK